MIGIEPVDERRGAHRHRRIVGHTAENEPDVCRPVRDAGQYSSEHLDDIGIVRRDGRNGLTLSVAPPE